MTTLYFMDEQHTLASALRHELEQTAEDGFVSCTCAHPLDQHIEVHAPNKSVVRQSLLSLKQKVNTCRAALLSPPQKG